MPLHLLLVAAGGAVGASLRYLLTLALRPRAHDEFPLATLIANLVGCFLIGALMAWIARQGEGPGPGENARLLLGVGLLGGFTTFSAFAWETTALLAAREYGRAGLYVAASNGLGLLAAAAGLGLVLLLLPTAAGRA